MKTHENIQNIFLLTFTPAKSFIKVSKDSLSTKSYLILNNFKWSNYHLMIISGVFLCVIFSGECMLRRCQEIKEILGNLFMNLKTKLFGYVSKRIICVLRICNSSTFQWLVPLFYLSDMMVLSTIKYLRNTITKFKF